MRRLAHLLAILAVGAFPLWGYTAPRFVTVIDQLLLSQSKDEAVQLLFAVRLNPPPLREDAMITGRLTLLDDPNNVAEGTFQLPGFMKATIKHRSGQADGCLEISVGNQPTEWCDIPMDNNRFVYHVSVERGARAQFLAGGEIPVPTASPTTAAVFLFDPGTGVTHAVDLIPIAVLEDNALVVPGTNTSGTDGAE